jgi:hypothetical protein
VFRLQLDGDRSAFCLSRKRRFRLHTCLGFEGPEVQTIDKLDDFSVCSGRQGTFLSASLNRQGSAFSKMREHTVRDWPLKVLGCFWHANAQEFADVSSEAFGIDSGLRATLPRWRSGRMADQPLRMLQPTLAVS